MARRLAAILAADVVGFSRLMEADETTTLSALKAQREQLIEPAISGHNGRVVKLMGDGLLAEFGSAVDAVECAAAVQRGASEHDGGGGTTEPLVLRIGINLGDVVIDGDDLYGDGVNVAARLEQLAEPGTVCVSGAVRDQVFDKIDFALDDLGEVNVKNIVRPIRIYRIAVASAPSAAPTPAARRDKPSIAVLPFVNMSGDPEQEYFSNGVTEDITTALSRLRWFFVVARNSSFVYKGRSVDVKQIGRELGVRYLLEGSIRKSGNRIRVTTQLVDTRSGAHHWAQTYDRDLTDIFELQDDITQSVTAAIEPKLVEAESVNAQSRSPEDLDAWDLVMRALAHYWRMTSAESDMAIGMLRQAVERYPDYGPAHSMLAFAILFSGHMGWTTENQENAYAGRLARRAAELDDDDPWAHIALGYLAFVGRQTDEAVRKYRRALELNPNFAIAHGMLGWALALDGRSDEAIPFLERALNMSPHDPLRASFYCGISVAHYLAGRYCDAVDWSTKGVHQRPGFTGAYWILCASLAQAGRTDDLGRTASMLRELQPNLSIAWCEANVPYTPRTMPHFLDGMRLAGFE